MRLELPEVAVSDRVSRVRRIGAGERVTVAELDGPGCIRHLFLVLNRPQRDRLSSRRAILRIYFDGAREPHVEAPVGDFFGVMHGEGYYEINCAYLSVKAWNGYNAYFPMPFAESARVEIEAGSEGTASYLQVDWHRYPGEKLKETLRFCARWRRENPAHAYGRDFLILDADGPGRLLGFVYGVRLIDDRDRWSHGGADNVYIDGEGDHPSFIRGIGGEDCFGSGFGGNLHPVDSHLYTGMPFYSHDDQGLARPAPRLTGYRFYEKDTITFRESVQLRFGCMANDICATGYWYQEGEVRRFAKSPAFDDLIPEVKVGEENWEALASDSGSWEVSAPFERHDSGMMKSLQDRDAFQSVEWTVAKAHHGFIDFNHIARPRRRGSGAHFTGVFGMARSFLHVEAAVTASIRFTWDDELAMALNEEEPLNLGVHSAFRSREIEVALRAGRNELVIYLANDTGSNHGGWAFAFRCRLHDGTIVHPDAGFSE